MARPHDLKAARQAGVGEARPHGGCRVPGQVERVGESDSVYRVPDRLPIYLARPLAAGVERLRGKGRRH